MASWGYGLYSDFKRYEGADQWIAAGITTMEMGLTIAGGLFISSFGAPVLLTVAAGVGIGMVIKGLGNWVRKSWLESSINRFMIYVVKAYREEKFYKYIKLVS